MVKKYVGVAGIIKASSPHFVQYTLGTNIVLNEAPLLVI
jgi:integrase/recombinase XerD